MIEAGDYNRNLQRQARTTSGSVVAPLQSAPSFLSRNFHLETVRPNCGRIVTREKAGIKKDMDLGRFSDCFPTRAGEKKMTLEESSRTARDYEYDLAFRLLSRLSAKGNIYCVIGSFGSLLASNFALAALASRPLKDGGV